MSKASGCFAVAISLMVVGGIGKLMLSRSPLRGEWTRSKVTVQPEIHVSWSGHVTDGYSGGEQYGGSRSTPVDVGTWQLDGNKVYESDPVPHEDSFHILGVLHGTTPDDMWIECKDGSRITRAE